MLNRTFTKLLRVFAFIILFIIVIQFFYNIFLNITHNHIEISTLRSIWSKAAAILLSSVFVFLVAYFGVCHKKRIGVRLLHTINKINAGKGLVGILLLAFVIRLLWILFIPTIPSSDFGLMYKYAQSVQQGNFNGFHNYAYFARFAHDTVTVLYFSLFYNLSSNHLFIIKFFNVLFSTLTVFYMYKIVKQLYGKQYGLLAAILLAIFPPFIMYNSQTMSENLALPLFLISVYYFVLLIKDELTSHWDKSRYLFFCGFALSIANMFRAIGSIFLFAYIIYFFVYKGIKSSVVTMPVLIACYVIPMYLLSSLLIFNGITDTYLWHDKEPAWTSVLRGTNFAYQGRWNPEDAKLPGIYNYNPDKVAQASKQIIKDRLYNASYQQISSLLLSKIGIEWASSDIGAYDWTLPAPSESDSSIIKLVRKFEPVMRVTTALFYLFLLLFSIFYLMENKDWQEEISFFLILFCTYVLLLLITEAQARYAFSLAWIFIIFAVGGFKGFGNPNRLNPKA